MFREIENEYGIYKVIGSKSSKVKQMRNILKY